MEAPAGGWTTHPPAGCTILFAVGCPGGWPRLWFLISLAPARRRVPHPSRAFCEKGGRQKCWHNGTNSIVSAASPPALAKNARTGHPSHCKSHRLRFFFQSWRKVLREDDGEQLLPRNHQSEPFDRRVLLMSLGVEFDPKASVIIGIEDSREDDMTVVCALHFVWWSQEQLYPFQPGPRFTHHNCHICVLLNLHDSRIVGIRCGICDLQSRSDVS